MAKRLDANKLIINVDKLAAEMKTLNAELKQTVAVISKGQAAFNKQSKSQGDLSRRTGKLVDAQKALEGIQKRSNKVTLETVRATEKLRQKRKALTDQVRKDEGTHKRFGRLWHGVAKGIIAAGVAMVGVQAAFRVAVNGIKKVISTSTSFAKGMSEVRAITGAVGESFRKLHDNALALGSSTPKTALEVAKLQKEFAKLGFTTKEILAATEATINLSIAAGSDLADSAVVAASTIRGFGLSATKTKKVVDVMAKSFTTSALDLEKFKTAMAVAAPVSKSFGKDIEFTTAQLAVLSDAGLDASTSGTSLRNMFLELSKRGLTWEEGLAKINESTNKSVTALNLFGKRGATAALILAENTDKAESLEKQFRNSAGAAKKMADIMQDNLAGDTAKANSAMEGLFITIGKKLEPAMRRTTQVFTRFVANLNESISPAKKSVNLYKLQNKELDVLFGSLKNTNLSQEARNELIDEVNNKYGEYLPNLLDEKSTLDEIEEAQSAINKQLRLKIIQQAFQQEINDLLQQELQAQKGLVSNEIDREKLRQEQIASVGELGAKTQQQLDNEKIFLGVLDDISTAQIDNNTNEIKSTEEKFKRIGELYGIAFAEIESILNDNTEVVEENNQSQIHAAAELAKAQAKIDEEVRNEKAKSYQEFLAKREAQDSEADKALIERKQEELVTSLEEQETAIAEFYQKKDELRKKDQEEELQALALGLERTKSLGNDLFSFSNQLRQNEIDSIEMQRDAEVAAAERAGQDTASIEAKFARKEKQLRIKQAKADRRQALFNIAIDTALGVVKAIALFGPPPSPLGIAGIAFAIATGAIQAATVAAKPIPKFEHGTDGMLKLATDAIVGEKGSELITTPKGDYLSPDRATKVHLPANSQVFKHDSPETQAAMSGGMSEEHYQGLIKEQQLTRKTIKANKPIVYTPDYIIEKQNNITIRESYLDKYF